MGGPWFAGAGGAARECAGGGGCQRFSGNGPLPRLGLGENGRRLRFTASAESHQIGAGRLTSGRVIATIWLSTWVEKATGARREEAMRHQHQGCSPRNEPWIRGGAMHSVIKPKFLLVVLLLLKCLNWFEFSVVC